LKERLKIFTAYHKYHLTQETEKNLKKILEIVSKSNLYLVNLFLVGRRKSQQLNCRYRKIDKPTDVLAFPFYYWYKEEIGYSINDWKDLGDLFICYPVAVKQSWEKKCSLVEEICFLFLHGLLHLLGYDHEKTADRKKMFLLQDKILNQLKIQNC
jgi:probable rRNA maturation factor